MSLIALDRGVVRADSVGDTVIANRFAPDILYTVYQLTAPCASLSSKGDFGTASRVETPIAKTSGGVLPFPVMSPEISKWLNRTEIAVDARSGRFALAFWFVSRLHIYSSARHLEMALAGPLEVRLDFAMHRARTGQVGFLRTQETRPAYIGVTADGDFIYALFSGRAFGEFGARHLMGDELHVYGWDGRYHGRWRLEQDVSTISLHGTRLYGVASFPDEHVVEFDIGRVRTAATGRQASQVPGRTRLAVR